MFGSMLEIKVEVILNYQYVPKYIYLTLTLFTEIWTSTFNKYTVTIEGSNSSHKKA